MKTSIELSGSDFRFDGHTTACLRFDTERHEHLGLEGSSVIRGL